MMRGRFKVFVVGMVMGGAVGAQPMVSPAMVSPGFAFLDRNHDGYLSPEELSRASGHLTPEVARFLDFDGDGAISPGEWRQGRQQVRSDVTRGVLQRGAQRLFSIQPPPTYLLGRYLELRQRYETTHRAAGRTLQEDYDDARDRYDDQHRAVDRVVQDRYDDARDRYDDQHRAVDRVIEARGDATQKRDDGPRARQRGPGRLQQHRRPLFAPGQAAGKHRGAFAPGRMGPGANKGGILKHPGFRHNARE